MRALNGDCKIAPGKRLRRPLLFTLGAVLCTLTLYGTARPAEPTDGRGETAGASKTVTQVVQEIRNALNAAWRKVTDPKTAEPARDSLNEGWKKITDPNTVEPVRRELNKAWKGLSDAASAAVGSSKTSTKNGKETKTK